MVNNLSDIKMGLVLAGGGAKGAYEVGVYKAIRELEIADNIKVISGTSVGAINALFFAMDDPKIISGSWSSLKYSRFLHNEERILLNNTQSLLAKIRAINSEGSIFDSKKLCDIGLLSQSGIRNFIDEYIDLDMIRESGKEIYVNAYNIDKERTEYFRLADCSEEEIKDRVLASCCIPHLFKPIIIDGMRYADGGINSALYSKNNVDNLPIYPMRTYDLDIIIVVHLSYKDDLNIDGFGDTKIVEIYPSSPLETINGMGTINLSKDTIEENIELGYRDAMVILAPMVVRLLRYGRLDELLDGDY